MTGTDRFGMASAGWILGVVGATIGLVLVVTETVRGTSCSDVGVLYTVDAELDAPLGDRELVDGS